MCCGTCGWGERGECRTVWGDGVVWRACCGWVRHGRCRPALVPWDRCGPWGRPGGAAELSGAVVLSLWWWMWAGTAWRRAWWGPCASTSRVKNGFRRACSAGAHLVLPGASGRSGPVDIVRVAAPDPAAWSHVRRYTIPDIKGHWPALCCWRPDRARLSLNNQVPHDAGWAVRGSRMAAECWGDWTPSPPPTDTSIAWATLPTGQ